MEQQLGGIGIVGLREKGQTVYRAFPRTEAQHTSVRLGNGAQGSGQRHAAAGRKKTLARFHALRQRILRIQAHLAHSRLGGLLPQGSAQQLHQGQRRIAHGQDGQAAIKELLQVGHGRGFSAGGAGKQDAQSVLGGNILGSGIRRQNLAVQVLCPQPARHGPAGPVVQVQQHDHISHGINSSGCRSRVLVRKIRCPVWKSFCVIFSLQFSGQ